MIVYFIIAAITFALLVMIKSVINATMLDVKELERRIDENKREMAKWKTHVIKKTKLPGE